MGNAHMSSKLTNSCLEFGEVAVAILEVGKRQALEPSRKAELIEKAPNLSWKEAKAAYPVIRGKMYCK